MTVDRPDDLRDVSFPAHDVPLREDVRNLGAMVGSMLAEQGGEAFFERIEQLRTAAIIRRETGAGVASLASMLAGVAPDEAKALARAFATWFHAVNMAERVHRIRRRRDYQVAGGGPQPESLLAVLLALKAQDVSADELRQWLARLDVEPVFTAHPTEAVRRSLLAKEQVIVRALVNDFDPTRPPRERVADRERMRTAFTTGWQTAEVSSVRPSVADEFERVGFYLAEPIYRVLPAFYEAFEHALQSVYGIRDGLPRVLRFGSWVGGDMDGNPAVGADTIADTLRAQRALVLERYRGECVQLAQLLSQTDDRIKVSAALRERVDAYCERLPVAAEAIRPRHRNMPYRSLLSLMGARLGATLDDAEAGYADVTEFVADVELIRASLAAHKGEFAGLFAVRRLLWRVRTFGFHLARLDVRQDARVHDDVLARLLDDPDWTARDADARAERLRPLATGETAFPTTGGSEGERLKAVFATLADVRQRYGADATGSYIVSMARQPADVLAVLALARLGGLVASQGGESAARAAAGRDLTSRGAGSMRDGSRPTAASTGARRDPVEALGTVVPLDIAPLFETVDDLEHGAATLRALVADPVYRAHLASRSEHQMIMLGYSDSAKDGGILAARWALQRAQVELLEVAHEAGIKLTFFHGRGGSASRGGGKITPALMASPRGSVAGRLRVTEQGEVIHRKYGIRALAWRNLEQAVGGALRASLRPRAPEPREGVWREQMGVLARISRDAYQDFVRDDDFVAYFRTATPIDVIERMTMGSRPASRRSMHGIEDLRCIPWVFAWTQMRTILPGWYGVGSALAHGATGFGEAAMVEMARDWPFFATLLDDVEMVLAKADLGIAEAFSRLSGDLHAKFFPRIEREFARTRDWLLRLMGSDALLADEPRLAQSIRLRNPYIDPMSLLQVDLLERWRAGNREDDAVLRALVACVNGVSQGLQNTG